jgi:UDP-N-acetylmuramyl pentapeptide phosphotransferase/UDP-N-acetylglucosamine-1-phosphate transferase
LLGGSLLLFLVSFADDKQGLPIAWRFLTHLFAAGMLTAALDPLSAVATAVTVLATVSMINIYNFMDGSDGLAGGMALLGFGCYGLAAGLAGELPFASVNLTVAAAALAFLFFNFHPARIFMGDSGSVTLGFLAAGLGIMGSLRGYWPVWFSPLVFSPFIVDATVTLARRLLRGEKVWLAHREHYYQRLVRMGCGHRATALLEYGLMLCVGASAVWAMFQREIHQIALLLLWASIYAALMAVVDLHWTRFLRRQVIDESAKV